MGMWHTVCPISYGIGHIVKRDRLENRYGVYYMGNYIVWANSQIRFNLKLKIKDCTDVSKLMDSISVIFGSRELIHAADSSNWAARFLHLVISNWIRCFIDEVLSKVQLHLCSTRLKSSFKFTEIASSETLSKAARWESNSASKSLKTHLNP